MKDIHEVKDNSFNHVRCRGVAARAGSIQWTGTHNSTILFLEDLQEPMKSTMSIVQHSLDRHTKTSMAFHHTLPEPHNPLPAWVEQIHLSHTDSLPTIPPGSSTERTGLEGLCQANKGAWLRSKVTPREGAPTSTSTGPVSKAQLQPNLSSKPASCTAHGRLGMPTRQFFLKRVTHQVEMDLQ